MFAFVAYFQDDKILWLVLRIQCGQATRELGYEFSTGLKSFLSKRKLPRGQNVLILYNKAKFVVARSFFRSHLILKKARKPEIWPQKMATMQHCLRFWFSLAKGPIQLLLNLDPLASDSAYFWLKVLKIWREIQIFQGSNSAKMARFGYSAKMVRFGYSAKIMKKACNLATWQHCLDIKPPQVVYHDSILAFFNPFLIYFPQRVFVPPTLHWALPLKL